MQRERDRDISEKIALGMPSAGAKSDELQFDQRLYSHGKVIKAKQIQIPDGFEVKGRWVLLYFQFSNETRAKLSGDSPTFLKKKITQF